MSEVVAVALITASSGFAVGTIGAIATYKVSQRTAEATVASADRQAETERERLQAEIEKLREQHREEERRNRQGIYHRRLVVVHDLYGTKANGVRVAHRRPGSATGTVVDGAGDTATKTISF